MQTHKSAHPLKAFMHACTAHPLGFLAWGQAKALLPCMVFFGCLWASHPLSHFFHTQGFMLPRYDLLLLLLLGFSAGFGFLWLKRMHFRAEDIALHVIFHLLGLVFEWFKVNYTASWSYEEAVYTSFLGVPLYVGFMYNTVAHYIASVCTHYRLSVLAWPRHIVAPFLVLWAYANFFMLPFLVYNPFIVIAFLIVVVFWRTKVLVRLSNKTYCIRLSLVLVFMGIFLYSAENLATFSGAWRYPAQEESWRPVSPYIVISWLNLASVPIFLYLYLRYFKRKNRLPF